jgi:type IV secretory pathway VirB3-like protein
LTYANRNIDISHRRGRDPALRGHDKRFGISLTTVGLILMIVGVVGLIISLFYMLTWAPRRGAVRDRVVERDPYV